MNDRCILGGYMVDENVSRLVGVFTFFASLLFLAFPSPWLAAAIALDFVPRALGKASSSPSVIAGSALRRLLGLPESLVNAGPKQFAAKLGLMMSMAILLLSVAGVPGAALGLAALLAACAALEGFVGFCVGCLLYSLLMRARERLATIR